MTMIGYKDNFNISKHLLPANASIFHKSSYRPSSDLIV